MEIRVLKYFLTVVREESISRAAEVLHITQPTLSRQLAQMEEETGVKLFQRGSRKITLTAEGILLRRRAEEIVELVDRTVAELPLQEKEVEGTISIGSGEVAAMEVLAQICGAFRKKHPKVIFDLYTATADVVKERMEKTSESNLRPLHGNSRRGKRTHGARTDRHRIAAGTCGQGKI